MKCEICNATMHKAGGVYGRDIVGRKRVLKDLQTMAWCTTPNCPNRMIYNRCLKCGVWVKTNDGIPPEIHICEVKK